MNYIGNINNMNDRVILHSDLNNFYASCECLNSPHLKQVPLVVIGDPRDRHGIVLAKNYPAKALNIKTGMVLWQAKQICPNIIVKIADFEKYLNFSRIVRKVYERYTDFIEPFGIDEAWLDVSFSKIFGSGQEIADKIRENIKKEIGLTASIGVSYNKIFAKLGSDMKKPDATTVITYEDFKRKIWSLPVESLLYVGKATTLKVKKLGIETIGDLANFDVNFLEQKLGVWGVTLKHFANGLDNSPVKKMGQLEVIKSVGNSLTAPKDLKTIDDIHALLIILAESVSARIYKYKLGKAKTLQLWIRDTNLISFSRQAKFAFATNNSIDFVNLSLNLFKNNYKFEFPVRSLGINVSNFDTAFQQITFFDQDEEKKFKLDRTIDYIREKHGHDSIFKAQVMLSDKLVSLNVETDHTIHPLSFFK